MGTEDFLFWTTNLFALQNDRLRQVVIHDRLHIAKRTL